MARPETACAAALCLTLLGCPPALPEPAGAPLDAADVDEAPPVRPVVVADAPVRVPGPLGELLQPLPALPKPGPLYEVAGFPVHTPPLLPGPEDDRRLVEQYCVSCHSTTYLSMQPPLSRAAWEAVVKKMLAVHGAVVPEPAAVRIATYLHSYYGIDGVRASRLAAPRRTRP